KRSSVHFLLLRKVFKAACKFWNTFLSVVDPIWLALTVSLACSSWLPAGSAATITATINIICLTMQHIYYSVNDIFCYLLFWLTFVGYFFASFLKNCDFISIMTKARPFIL